MAQGHAAPFLAFYRDSPHPVASATGGNKDVAAALSSALAEALAKIGPRLPARPVRSRAELEKLGAALADVIAGGSAIVRVPDASGPALATLLEKLARIAEGLDAARQEAAIAKLADIMLPDDLAAARGPLASDNLELRDRFVAETRPLTSGEVAELAGFTGKNRYATAARWKKAGDVFSVHHRGSEYFPAFQFRDGRPHPTVRLALAALPARMSPWQRAFWFVSTNGWLADRAPADVLDDPEAVLHAAAREGEAVVG